MDFLSALLLRLFRKIAKIFLRIDYGANYIKTCSLKVVRKSVRLFDVFTIISQSFRLFVYVWSYLNFRPPKVQILGFVPDPKVHILYFAPPPQILVTLRLCSARPVNHQSSFKNVYESHTNHQSYAHQFLLCVCKICATTSARCSFKI